MAVTAQCIAGNIWNTIPLYIICACGCFENFCLYMMLVVILCIRSREGLTMSSMALYQKITIIAVILLAPMESLGFLAILSSLWTPLNTFNTYPAGTTTYDYFNKRNCTVTTLATSDYQCHTLTYYDPGYALVFASGGIRMLYFDIVVISAYSVVAESLKLPTTDSLRRTMMQINLGLSFSISALGLVQFFLNYFAGTAHGPSDGVFQHSALFTLNEDISETITFVLTVSLLLSIRTLIYQLHTVRKLLIAVAVFVAATLVYYYSITVSTVLSYSVPSYQYKDSKGILVQCDSKALPYIAAITISATYAVIRLICGPMVIYRVLSIGRKDKRIHTEVSIKSIRIMAGTSPRIVSAPSLPAVSPISPLPNSLVSPSNIKLDSSAFFPKR